MQDSCGSMLPFYSKNTIQLIYFPTHPRLLCLRCFFFAVAHMTIWVGKFKLITPLIDMYTCLGTHGALERKTQQGRSGHLQQATVFEVMAFRPAALSTCDQILRKREQVTGLSQEGRAPHSNPRSKRA